MENRLTPMNYAMFVFTGNNPGLAEFAETEDEVKEFVAKHKAQWERPQSRVAIYQMTEIPPPQDEGKIGPRPTSLLRNARVQM